MLDRLAAGGQLRALLSKRGLETLRLVLAGTGAQTELRRIEAELAERRSRA